ncbi:MAG: sulfite exporter TauE/SafE family protein [Pseudomonadota bacterium]|nr:urease accessory protein [Gammaproteobacteria bacterium]MDQ3580127.1 sulfite exporter TauE/SafE family protein [Pseudomonadota bacterium]
MDTHALILALAFGLGMLHALDADHIAAVANLAGHGPSRRHALLAGGLWALGHGLSLLLLGAAVLLFGVAIPERFSALAEHLIALVLIGIGLWALWDLYRRRVHLHFHSHDGLVPHGHLHAHGKGAHEGCSYDHRDHTRDPHAHDHGVLLIGGLHGVAGTAPVLALVPVAKLGSVWLGIAYLLLFSLGVLLTMLLFGCLLGQLMVRLTLLGAVFIAAIRSAVALGTIGLGTHMLYGG